MKTSSNTEDGIRAAWWYDLLWGVVFAFAAFGAYRYFVWFESSDRSVVMWAPVAFVYDLSGKWGVVAVLCILSVVCFASGRRKLLAIKSSGQDNAREN